MESEFEQPANRSSLDAVALSNYYRQRAEERRRKNEHSFTYRYADYFMLGGALLIAVGLIGALLPLLFRDQSSDSFNRTLFWVWLSVAYCGLFSCGLGELRRNSQSTLMAVFKVIGLGCGFMVTFAAVVLLESLFR